MPVPKGLSKSPFEINTPSDRWRPDIDNTKKVSNTFNAPFINKIREEILIGDSLVMMTFQKPPERF